MCRQWGTADGKMSDGFVESGELSPGGREIMTSGGEREKHGPGPLTHIDRKPQHTTDTSLTLLLLPGKRVYVPHNIYRGGGWVLWRPLGTGNTQGLATHKDWLQSGTRSERPWRNRKLGRPWRNRKLRKPWWIDLRGSRAGALLELPCFCFPLTFENTRVHLCNVQLCRIIFFISWDRKMSI